MQRKSKSKSEITEFAFIYKNCRKISWQRTLKKRGYENKNHQHNRPLNFY